MNIIVCVKRTPDTTSKIKVSQDGKSVDTQGIEWVINPYDEFAIEEGIRLREKFGGEVTIVSLDPDNNQTILRKALAMGCDKAILIHGGANYDSFLASQALVSVIKDLKYDIILMGKQAIDDDNYQVPSMVAYLLSLPVANVVTKLEIGDVKATCNRQVEGADEVLEISLPCVVSCQRGLNEPRFASLRGIMEAKKKSLQIVPCPQLESTVDIVKIELPSVRPPGRVVGQGKEAVPELVRLLNDEAKVL